MFLDDTESHGFKCVRDELFGRENFVMDGMWHKRDGVPKDRKVGSVHENVFVWANFRESVRRGQTARVDAALQGVATQYLGSYQG